MTGALTWLGRLTVLALSLLATLSIIGAIAAIPSGSVEGRLGIDRPQAEPGALPEAQPAETILSPEHSIIPSQPAAEPVVHSRQQGVERKRDDPLRWLEPLTYAVIALAGLMALAVLFLWQAVAALNRLERR